MVGGLSGTGKGSKSHERNAGGTGSDLSGIEQADSALVVSQNGFARVYKNTDPFRDLCQRFFYMGFWYMNRLSRSILLCCMSLYFSAGVFPEFIRRRYMQASVRKEV